MDWQEKESFERRRAHPLDVTGKGWEYLDKILFIKTSFSVHTFECKSTIYSDMPAFGDTLEDEEIVTFPSDVESVRTRSYIKKIGVRQNQNNVVCFSIKYNINY